MPAAEQRTGRGINRQWRLADVVKHLHAPEGEDNGEDKSYINKEEPLAMLKGLIGKTLYPGLLCSRFMQDLTGLMRYEFKLTKAQALRAYQIASFAIGSGLAEHLDDEGLMLTVPEHVVELGKVGPEAYAKKYWADRG